MSCEKVPTGNYSAIYHTMNLGITQTFTEHLRLSHNFTKLTLIIVASCYENNCAFS